MSTRVIGIKEQARQFPEEVFSEGSLDLLDDIGADDFVGRPSAVPRSYHGPEGMKEFVSTARTESPDLGVTAEDVIEQTGSEEVWNRTSRCVEGTRCGAGRGTTSKRGSDR